MTLTAQSERKHFWNQTALKFGGKDDYTPVLHPSARGLLNWYTDLLHKNALRIFLKDLGKKMVLDVGCGVGRWSKD